MPIPDNGYNALSAAYPDDRSDKEVFVQAAGQNRPADPSTPRHVLIYWRNSIDADAIHVYDQTIQLEKQGNYYYYYYPNVQKRDIVAVGSYQTFTLGTLTWQQREILLELAEDVEYDKGSLLYGCRVWTRKLLAAMAHANLIGAEVYDHIRQDVPLPSSIGEWSEGEVRSVHVFHGVRDEDLVKQ